MAKSAYDFTAFGNVFETTSISDASRDGIYRVGSDKKPLDLLLEGMPGAHNSKFTLVFFGGAVERKGKVGPFFSGRGIAKALGMPLISISDPALELEENLRIGWYSGYRGYSHLPKRISNVLNLYSAARETQLLLIGGSAGGFGILNVMQHMKNDAKALIWNPQTRVTSYHRRHVSDYVGAITGRNQPLLSQEFSQRILDKTGLETDVTRANAAGGGVLYCQNISDQHVKVHLEPYMAHGKWQDVTRDVKICPDRNATVCLANWGEGHAPLPKDTLISSIKSIVSRKPLSEIALDISSKHPTTIG